VISLPSNAASNAQARNNQMNSDKLFDVFVDSLGREVSTMQERINRLRETLEGSNKKLNDMKMELKKSNESISQIESDLHRINAEKSCANQAQMEVLDAMIVELKESSVCQAVSRDALFKHGTDIENQISSVSANLSAMLDSLNGMKKIESDFITLKIVVDQLKRQVDDLYKDILISFQKKNELELKRIMDPSLDDKEALEMLAARQKCESELQMKVASFIDLRSKWNLKRNEGIHFIQVNKTKIITFTA